MFNPLDLSNRCVLVTGASSGIGRATAVYLARLGARLVLVGRDIGRLNETASRCAESNPVIEPFDLGTGDAIVGWLKQLTARVGPLDGLVHSAAIQSYFPLRVLSTEIMAEMYQINAISAAMLIRAMQQKGCHRPEASIVLVSSTAGILGVPANGAYGASKAAIIAMVKSFCLELIDKRIRLNCVAPGLVETEMVDRAREVMPPELFQAMVDQHPLGMGKPDDVAYAIAFLLSPAARWITGTTLMVDGALSVR